MVPKSSENGAKIDLARPFVDLLAADSPKSRSWSLKIAAWRAFGIILGGFLLTFRRQTAPETVKKRPILKKSDFWDRLKAKKYWFS